MTQLYADPEGNGVASSIAVSNFIYQHFCQYRTCTDDEHLLRDNVKTIFAEYTSPEAHGLDLSEESNAVEGFCEDFVHIGLAYDLFEINGSSSPPLHVRKLIFGYHYLCNRSSKWSSHIYHILNIFFGSLILILANINASPIIITINQQICGPSIYTNGNVR